MNFTEKMPPINSNKVNRMPAKKIWITKGKLKYVNSIMSEIKTSFFRMR